MTLVQYQPGQAVGASSQEAGRRGDEPLVHNRQFEEVLGKCPRLQVIVVRLAHTPQEAHRPRPPQLEAQHAKHEAFSLEDLIRAVSAIDHVDNLLQRRAVYLLVF
jgi:hypothetical protein